MMEDRFKKNLAFAFIGMIPTAVKCRSSEKRRMHWLRRARQRMFPRLKDGANDHAGQDLRRFAFSASHGFSPYLKADVTWDGF